jgi:MFS transporter, MHS family, alpha-ketoglutarate permease
VLGILQLAMKHDDIVAWGWRIPFVVGAATAVISMLLRRSLHETTTSAERSSQAAGSIASLLKHHGRAFVTVLGFTAGGSLIFYAFTTYMQKYLVNTAHMSKETASVIMTVCLLVYALLQPVFGALSDRIGRKTSMIWFGGLAAVCTVPIMMTLGDVKSPWVAGLLITCALAIVSLYTSISGLLKAEMFPVEVRALGVGLSYAVANAIFGGSAEFVALSFKTAGHEQYFYWYVSGMCLLAMIVAIRMPNHTERGLLK